MTTLHRVRLARGQTLREMAADCGVSYETIRRVVYGGAVHPRTRLKLERALGLPFDLLTAPIKENGATREGDAARTVPTAERAQENRHGY